LLLAKETPSIFSNDYLDEFYKIKKALITTPIIQLPNWSLLSQIMGNASDYVVGVILGQ